MSRRIPVWAITAAVLLALPAAPAQALPRGTHVQLFKHGLRQVVDMAWVPGTRKLFYDEKNTGRIRVIVRGRLLRRPCANLDVVNDGERGALGLALDPAYATNHYLYVYFTKRSPLENRVTRFIVRSNRCTHPHPLVTTGRSMPEPLCTHRCSMACPRSCAKTRLCLIVQVGSTRRVCSICVARSLRRARTLAGTTPSTS